MLTKMENASGRDFEGEGENSLEMCKLRAENCSQVKGVVFLGQLVNLRWRWSSWTCCSCYTPKPRFKVLKIFPDGAVHQGNVVGGIHWDGLNHLTLMLS